VWGAVGCGTLLPNLSHWRSTNPRVTTVVVSTPFDLSPSEIPKTRNPGAATGIPKLGTTSLESTKTFLPEPTTAAAPRASRR